MKTILIREAGGPDVLTVADVAVPEPRHGEVLIKVGAAGVNRPDLLQRMGLYPPPRGASNIPGLEVAGEVAKLGEGVSRLQVGDKVAALTAGGGYAEFALALEGSCMRVPAGFSMEDAAALPETFMTVWHNVFERGGLKEGEVFLVHGGASGIGTAAIQLASRFGARVFATASTVEKCAYCESLGAERAINYLTHSFVTEIKAATGGAGANVILDMVGGEYVRDNIVCAAEDGRIVQIAFLKGSKVQLDLMPVMLKRLMLTGSTLRPRNPAFKAHLARELEELVWPLLERGEVKPMVTKTFRLEEAGAAHRWMDSSKHMGKIVLLVE
jgi:NADPH:quinone reductase